MNMDEKANGFNHAMNNLREKRIFSVSMEEMSIIDPDELPLVEHVFTNFVHIVCSVDRRQSTIRRKSKKTRREKKRGQLDLWK